LAEKGVRGVRGTRRGIDKRELLNCPAIESRIESSCEELLNVDEKLAHKNIIRI
jgi:hypothetical protein